MDCQVVRRAKVGMDDVTVDPWQRHLRQLGIYLKAQRAANQLSQRELARQARVSNAYISHLENGRHEPSISVLCALAEQLRIRPEELLLYAAGLPVPSQTSLETAIETDPRLSDEQRTALLEQLQRYLEDNDVSGEDA
jgi:transcriptional regulator with XRE-family HTH domain